MRGIPLRPAVLAATAITALAGADPWSDHAPARWAAALGVAADGSDPDGDGLGNLTEYALGTDPLAAASASHPRAVVIAEDGVDYPGIAIARAGRAADIGYLVEISRDGTTWETGGWHLRTVTDTETALVVRDRTPLGTPGRTVPATDPFAHRGVDRVLDLRPPPDVAGTVRFRLRIVPPATRAVLAPGAAWRERIRAPGGGIDWAAYAALAAGYHTRDGLAQRLGPAADDMPPRLPAPAPAHQPVANGVFRGNGVAGAFREEGSGRWSEQGGTPEGDPGGAWIMSGQMLFSPDPDAPADLRAGCANMRMGDGAVSFAPAYANQLCLRLVASWEPDWWNRNSISAPTSPAIPGLEAAFGPLPLPPVATARGAGGASVTGFLAFRNGVVGVAGTGNDPYTSEGAGYVGTRLPPGKVPTAMAATLNNEFVLVTTWDPAERKGQLAVIAVEGRLHAQEARFYYGLPSWPVVRRLKVLGLVDLPFAAPSALDVTLDTSLGNPRGSSANAGRWGDFSDPVTRAGWASPPTPYDDWKWRHTARHGYAIVASRAEDRVAIVDLRPLLAYYRSMYFSTQERYLRTVDAGPGPGQWPPTFAEAPEQVPVVVGDWPVPEPTAVAALNTWNGVPGPRLADIDTASPLRTAYIASMDGTLGLHDVRALVDPARYGGDYWDLAGPARATRIADLSGRLGSRPFRITEVGRNPVDLEHSFFGIHGDDLLAVSRADRMVVHLDFRGRIEARLRDARLLDPVGVRASFDTAGFGGSGPGRTVTVPVLSVMDHRGRQVLTYALDLLRGGGEDALRARHPEDLPIRDEDGRPLPWILGSGRPVPGMPFMFTTEEVI